MSKDRDEKNKTWRRAHTGKRYREPDSYRDRLARDPRHNPETRHDTREDDDQ